MGTTLDGRVIPGNRFTKTVKIHSAALAKRLADGAITQEDIDKMEASLDDTSQMDLHSYQNAQSQAFACGEITMEEAQSLFKAFGGDAASEVQWKKQPVAVKSAATAFAGELIMKACKRPGVLP